MGRISAFKDREVIVTEIIGSSYDIVRFVYDHLDSIIFIEQHYAGIEQLNASFYDGSPLFNYITNIASIPNYWDMLQAYYMDRSKILTIFGKLVQITDVYNNLIPINTVANNIGNITTVRDNIANVNVVGSNISKINVVNTNIVSINNVANNISSINTILNDMATIPASINTITGLKNAIALIAQETQANALSASQDAELAEEYKISAAASYDATFRLLESVDNFIITEQDTDVVIGSLKRGQMVGNRTNGRLFIGTEDGMFSLQCTYTSQFRTVAKNSVRANSTGDVSGIGVIAQQFKPVVNSRYTKIRVFVTDFSAGARLVCRVKADDTNLNFGYLEDIVTVQDTGYVTFKFPTMLLNRHSLYTFGLSLVLNSTDHVTVGYYTPANFIYPTYMTEVGWHVNLIDPNEVIEEDQSLLFIVDSITGIPDELPLVAPWENLDGEAIRDVAGNIIEVI